MEKQANVPRTNELAPNMGLVYLTQRSSRAISMGNRSGIAGRIRHRASFPIPNRAVLEPITGAIPSTSRARRIQYLAPIGEGVTFTAGLFKGAKSYEEFYAKYNLNYTRAYLPITIRISDWVRGVLSSDQIIGAGSLRGH